MNVLVVLIPVSLLLGLGSLAAFLWSLRAEQYDDLEGDAAQGLLEDAAPFDADQGAEGAPMAPGEGAEHRATPPRRPVPEGDPPCRSTSARQTG
ncbi:cbb3-type cytochrome oxidase assembly protein CcoS [Jannaschia sp. W003]|uniref:cbb3-type cytochrome oxidase assembly protein CcoS n=1 Tax=Jannaschia sp. W003 TaxID=2867012 RepID=UPI0028830AA9|nr:cbb3-type cytochrome oxidase assembly protein CcoS [Jannaschia sp. W003]